MYRHADRVLNGPSSMPMRLHRSHTILVMDTARRAGAFTKSAAEEMVAEALAPAATQQVADISPMGRKRHDGIGKTLPWARVTICRYSQGPGRGQELRGSRARPIVLGMSLKHLRTVPILRSFDEAKA